MVGRNNIYYKWINLITDIEKSWDLCNYDPF